MIGRAIQIILNNQTSRKIRGCKEFDKVGLFKCFLYFIILNYFFLIFLIYFIFFVFVLSIVLTFHYEMGYDSVERKLSDAIEFYEEFVQILGRISTIAEKQAKNIPLSYREPPKKEYAINFREFIYL